MKKLLSLALLATVALVIGYQRLVIDWIHFVDDAMED